MTANPKSLVVAALAAGLVLGGCAPKRNLDLVRAETAYRDASADPAVRLYASPQLSDAQVSLQRAQREWADDHDAKEMRHLGYVVERQVQIARVTAQKEVAKREASQLQGAVIGAPLPLSESLLIAWPQIVGLVAGSILVFVAGYIVFQRQEVRA